MPQGMNRSKGVRSLITRLEEAEGHSGAGAK